MFCQTHLRICIVMKTVMLPARLSGIVTWLYAGTGISVKANVSKIVSYARANITSFKVEVEGFRRVSVTSQD